MSVISLQNHCVSPRISDKITDRGTVRKRKTHAAFFTALVLAIPLFILLFTADASYAASMEEAFLGRNWGVMDSIYRDARSGDADVGSRDLSLYANALWMQRRYAEGLALLESADAAFPPSLEPYARMLSVLGMERLGRASEAYDAAAALWPSAPGALRYYLAYAAGRLARGMERTDDALRWFRLMQENAPDKKRRVEALKEIVSLPGATVTEAALLLADSPSDARALALCQAAPKGSNTTVEYALGYRAYTRKSYAEARARLASAYGDRRFGEAARYYHAFAFFREKKYDSAFNIWSGVALYGNEFPQRSVQRLITLGLNGKKGEVLRVFRKVADTRGDYPDLAADALAAIARLGDEQTAPGAVAELSERFPASDRAASAHWENGWKAWKDKNYRAAADAWEKGYVPGIANRELASRLLYWRARALESMGSVDAMAKMGEVLARSYPGEYYTYLAREDGGVVSSDIPQAFMAKSELEEWGFVTYARIESASEANAGDPAAQFRASRLANWEGDFASSVRSFGVFQRLSAPEALASSELLKYAYPRAFEPDVAAAAGKTGLDPAVIWAIMRQESLYEPDVTSVAGAYGLMQLMPATAKGESKKMNLPEDAYKRYQTNILLGANHMNGLLARFKDLPRALAAYNAGGAPVTRWSPERISDMAEWIENIPYHETRGYVKAVLRNAEVYRSLYGGR